MSFEYKEVIEELKEKKEELTKLIKTSDKSKYETELSRLKINKLTRQSPVEVLYDVLIYFQNNNEILLNNKYKWTHTVDSSGTYVDLGCFYSDGVYINGYSGSNSYSRLVVVFCYDF
jgi:hypothetical protein